MLQVVCAEHIATAYDDRMSQPQDTLDAIFDEHIAVARASRNELIPSILELAASLEPGGKLLAFGNGGSAAVAQHFAARLLGRSKLERPALPALALTTNKSALAAISNDWHYDRVFARQVEGLARAGDLVVDIGTSGGAESMAAGLRTAQALGARTWALTGAGGGLVADGADRSVRVPSTVTARVQEIQIAVTHAGSELVERRLATLLESRSS